jgi:hypothetical protein
VGISIYPSILHFDTNWRLVVSFTSRALYPRYPLDRRLDGTQNLSGWCGGKNVASIGTRTATGLFNDDLNSSSYTASNCRMVREHLL